MAVAALGYGITTRAGRDTKDDNSPAACGAAELRADKGIPVQYRRLIVDSAHDCLRPEAGPALVAAMLKAESDFDANLADPAKDEYGIARWTPSILRWWIRADGEQAQETPRPPLPPRSPSRPWPATAASSNRA
ncbi:hypothetical protein GCM10010121_034080 [Streptomyces brasiliensis]|uniref:Uncharacterized protein n=1 Tax=Streptomyces brasiliensis TaxID=1954 RepID=A0A917KQZ3_9ACTN|nr:hypothetical protein GCM10010121_034080 [Streptomyces brasiliensis]